MPASPAVSNGSTRAESGPRGCVGAWTFLPAHAGDGSVKAWTMLDCEDYGWAREYRWAVDRTGYFYRARSCRTENGKPIRMHREILNLENGEPPEGDHINRDRADNRRMNLRITNRHGNGQNVSLRSDNTSGYRGVSYDPRREKWGARVMLDQRTKHVGYFDSAEEAAEAAAAFRADHMPFSID